MYEVVDPVPPVQPPISFGLCLLPLMRPEYVARLPGMDNSHHSLTDAWLRSIRTVAEDPAAVMTAAEALSNLAMTFLRWKGVREADVSDALREVVIRVAEKFPQFRGTSIGEFVVWLKRVVRHVARTFLRRYAREVLEADKLGDDSDDLFSAFAVPGDVLNDVAAAELTSILRKALSRIPKRTVEAIVLRDEYELRYHEIAARMGVSDRRVKVILFEGRRELRERLVELLLAYAYLGDVRLAYSSAPCLHDPQLPASQLCDIRVEVGNGAPVRLQDVLLSVFFDDVVVANSAVTIPAGGVIRLSISAVPFEPGRAFVKVSLSRNKTSVDWRREFIFPKDLGL